MIKEIFSVLTRNNIPFAGYSTDGVTVVGDSKSVNKVSHWHFVSDTVEHFWRPEVIRLREEIKTLRKQNDERSLAEGRPSKDRTP